MLKNKKFWTITALGICGLCIIACVVFIVMSGLGKVAYQALEFNNRVGIGKQAPDFESQTITGEAIQLKMLQGKPLVLIFSASWCPDCVREIPYFQEAHNKYPQLQMLLIDSGENIGDVQAFIENQNISIPVLLDAKGEISDQYDIYAIPSAFFLDKNGIIQTHLIDVFDEAQVEIALKSIGIGSAGK